MAAWLWILEYLLGDPDVSIQTIKELARYVSDEGVDVHTSLKKRLILRHLEEFLASDQPFEPSVTIPLVEDLDLSKSDSDKVVEWMSDGSAKARKSLVQFIRKEKAAMEVPVLKKVARDHSMGVYPVPLRVVDNGDGDSPPPPATNGKADGHAKVTTVRKQRSVGSEDTTVLLDGESPDRQRSKKKRNNAERESSPDRTSAEIEKPLSENVTTRKRAKRKRSEEESEDEQEEFDVGQDRSMEECYKCRKRGRLLICDGDGCPVAMHPQCVGLKEVPEGEWRCPMCVIKLANDTVAKAQKDAINAKKQYDKLFTKGKANTDEDYVLSTKRLRDPSPEQVRSDNARVSMPGVRRQKLPWSYVEEETLRKYFQKYGPKWTQILEHGRGKFDPTRTSVDLKDKWRNLTKSSTS